MLALALLTLLSLTAFTKGAWINWWAQLLRRVFGWGAYGVAAFMVVGGAAPFLSVQRRQSMRRWQTVTGLELLFLAALAVLHLLAGQADPLQVAMDGRGGGYVGWAVSRVLVSSLGGVGAWMFLLLVLVGGAILSLDVSSDQLRRGWGLAREGLVVIGRSAWRRLARPSYPVSAEPALPDGLPTTPKAPKSRKAKAAGTAAETQAADDARRKRQVGLPPIDLLSPSSPQEFSETDARLKAALIEETLSSFGVPARVVEINVGPVVTQFGVEPGFTETTTSDGEVRRRKVRVSKIINLSNDLSLALAASPIRVEAPVPGRSVVGIEVPNAKVALVSLRSVLETEAYRRSKAPLRVALGQDVSGRPVFADLAAMPHLLIAGATGSGKSVCINVIAASLICGNRPEELRLLLIDPKMVELTRYNGLPHLMSSVVVELEQAVACLRWVTKEMDARYRRFAAAKARHLDDYNLKAGQRGEPPLPRIVVFIDELADLMMMAPDEVERSICRVAQMARATGIHLVIATQRPSVDVVTGLIKANFPARISFAVTSQIDSRVVLDSPGAERLLGRGDMLYMASDSSRLVRLQGCFVSDREIDRLVTFWREARTDEPPLERIPWDELEQEQDEDDLLDQAVALVKESGRASASMLQRRMRIGYPRAARLIDIMEERGIIGPPEGRSRVRKVIEDMKDFESGESALAPRPSTEE